MKDSIKAVKISSHFPGPEAKLRRPIVAGNWKMNGGLRLACTQERWIELKRQATTAHSFGLDMELLNRNEANELWPFMEVVDVIGAAFLPRSFNGRSISDRPA